jgi:hypothetical protein
MAGGREQPSAAIDAEELAEGAAVPVPALYHNEAQAADTCSKCKVDAGALGKEVAEQMLGGEDVV